jgi:hypothetical protein
METKVTSQVEMAMQFFWQGYDTYVKCHEESDLAACFFNAQCENSNVEYIRIVPITESRSKGILDMMKVRIISVSSGKFLRPSRLSKNLKWSSTCDEKSLFRIHILDGKPMEQSSKFTLESAFWEGYQVGFSTSLPLTKSRENALSKAIGLLTLEKRKKSNSLIFPLRFRALTRSHRILENSISMEVSDDNSSISDEGNINNTGAVIVTLDEHAFYQDASEHEAIPIASIVSSSPATYYASRAPDLRHQNNNEPENCCYCGVYFRRRCDLQSHIRDYHHDMLVRPSVAGSFCIHCGYRCFHGVCARCP